MSQQFDTGVIAPNIEEIIEAHLALTDDELDAELRRLELDARDRAARRAALLAVAESRNLHAADGHRSLAAYLRATCNGSPGDVGRDRKLARLVDTVPAIGDALLAGHIGVAQALEISRVQANRRIGHLVGDVAPVLLDQAEHLPYADFKVCVDRIIMLLDLDGAFDDLAANLEHRTAHVTIVGDAIDITASGGDPLTAATMLAIYERFCEREYRDDVEQRRNQHGDAAEQHPLPRSNAQRRFDALAKIFEYANAALEAGLADGRGAPKLVVDIIADAATVDSTFTRAGVLLPDGQVIDPDTLDTTCLDALADHLTSDGNDSILANLADRRCETATGVPIHPIVMLQAALTGHVRRVVIDSEGVVIDLGRTQRLFTGSARTAAQLLVRHCTHPGCLTPTHRCDIDHNLEWGRDDGTTDQRNGRIACGPHDRHKHRRRWRTRRDADGRVYTVRDDGSLVLPVGERPPDLTADEHAELARRRLRDLRAA